MSRLMLLDGNGLIYRGFFALPPLTTSQGELVNAVFGFCSILLRGLQDVKPDYLAVAFDLSGPTFRHEAFQDYKAQRKPMPDELRAQFPLVREVVAAFRMPVFELQGYEADDCIGTLTRQAEAQGIETTIVSGDMDMIQLVSDLTSLMSTRSGVQNTVTYDPAAVRERYGIDPIQMIDFKALKGDVTDNIPGVPGVGEKTAAKLIADFGSIDGIYQHIDEVQGKLREKLVEGEPLARQSHELATIIRDLPLALDLAAARLNDYDRDEVIRLFRRFEFRTLIDRLPPLVGESAAEAAEALRGIHESNPLAAARVAGAPEPRPAAEPKPAFGRSARPAAPAGGAGELQLSLDFDVVSGAAGAAPVSRPLAEMPATKTGNVFATSEGGVDAKTGETSVQTGAAKTGEGSAETAEGLAKTLPEPSGDPIATLRELAHDPASVVRVGMDALPAIEAWLSGQAEVGIALVADDARPLRGAAQALGLAAADGRAVAVTGEDAATAARQLVERLGIAVIGHEVKPLLVARFAEDLQAPATPIAFDTQLAAYLLNASLRSQPIAEVVAERLDIIVPPPATLDPAPRAALSALGALAVRPRLAESLEEIGLTRLLQEIELPLVPVLARMEATGVAIDREALAALQVEFASEIERLQREIFEDVGHEFNLGSPKQLEQVLFFELNLPKGKKTAGGSYSTDANVLEGLRPAHPMIGKLLDWRLYTKLRSTYVEQLPALVAPADGRLHTTFHQAVAATGRLSSSDPNLQNIPIRTPLGRRIRRAFVAGNPAENVLVAADYSQIELRVLAHVSGDEHLRDAFARGADIHRETAALVLHKAPEEITKDERSMAKMVNFGIAYGMSDFGLATRAGIPRAEAKAFIDRYFATYSGISYYMLHVRELAKTQGYVTTLLGRRRQIPELQATNQALRAAGERMAINMPIQGTAADIIKIAMIRLAARLREGGFRSKLLLQVHDELVLEVPRDEVDRLIPLLRETMEHALPLDVPLTVDVRTGDDWESMTPVLEALPVAVE